MLIFCSFLLFSAVPSAPRDFRGTDITSSSTTLEWKAPEKDGGAPITDYLIERREKTYGSWRPEATIKAPVLTHGVKRLIEGSDYYFRICAENCEGRGPWTEIEDAVKPSKEKSMHLAFLHKNKLRIRCFAKKNNNKKRSCKIAHV